MPAIEFYESMNLELDQNKERQTHAGYRIQKAMDAHQPHLNQYHPASQHLQRAQQHSFPQTTGQQFQPGFVPCAQPYFHHPSQQGHAQGLHAPYGTTAAPGYHNATAPPLNNAWRYAPSQQFNLPVHGAIPAQRRPTQPSQLVQAPASGQIPQQHPPVPHVPQVQTTNPVQKDSNNNAKQDKHLKDLKCIPNPPDLGRWRERLFNVDNLLVLTEDQFQTYFPHIDNVYSHRSTQPYKSKPFTSYYYDCRLKGRPAGTPKSSDPTKKKRKRVARERDLCHVKIKITEYEAGASREDIAGHLAQQPRSGEGVGITADAMLGGAERASQRFYTIMRVNGTGANAKEGEDGGHLHSLEESDRIKRNSVIRSLEGSGAKPKAKPKSLEKKSYHTKATGTALATVKKHSKDHPLKLYGSCFCPFVQRVWISLECKKLDYQYLEIDPYQKPEWYLKINPRGLVPSLSDGDWVCYESTVLMEYLEDLNRGEPLLPADPKQRAHSRLWTDHINRKILPGFYAYLQAQDPAKQADEGSKFKGEIEKLVKAAHPEGPFFLGPKLGFVDIQFAPWIIRLSKVLKPYRGWPEPEPGSRWARWVEAVENDPFVRATTSGDELYLDSYERYAENRPGTSQVADAINSGRGLP